MLQLHVTRDRKLINKADGKQVDPKQYGIEINGDTVRCGGGLVSGGGSMSNGNVTLSVEPLFQNIVNAVGDMTGLWGGGIGSVVANDGGDDDDDDGDDNEYENDDADDNDDDDDDDDVQEIELKPSSRSGKSSSTTRNGAVDYVELVKSAIQAMRAGVVKANSMDILLSCTADQICAIVRSCLKAHRASTVQDLVCAAPHNFKPNWWSADHWGRLIKSCLEEHRAGVLIFVMRKVPSASLDVHHVRLALDAHRADCAIAFAAFSSKRTKLEAASKSSAAVRVASSGTAALGTAASAAVSVVVVPEAAGDDDLKAAIRQSLADQKASCKISLLDDVPVSSAAAAATGSAVHKSNTIQLLNHKCNTIQLLNPSQLKDMPANLKQDGDACSVCSDNKRIVVNTGCGHASICLACVPKFKFGAKCPLCTKLIVSWLAVS